MDSEIVLGGLLRKMTKRCFTVQYKEESLTDIVSLGFYCCEKTMTTAILQKKTFNWGDLPTDLEV